MTQSVQPFTFNPETQSDQNHVDRDEAIVNIVFTNLYGLYPSQFKKAFSTQSEIDQAKAVWMKSLMEAGVTSIRQLELAFTQLVNEKHEFLPSAPVFIAHCFPSPARLGLSSVRQTYLECCKNSHHTAVEWSSQFAYNVGKTLGFYYLRNLPERQSYLLFADVYNDLLKQFIKGEKLEFELPKIKSADPVMPPSFEHLKNDLERIRHIKKMFDD
jgi:hypothetical protein